MSIKAMYRSTFFTYYLVVQIFNLSKENCMIGNVDANWYNKRCYFEQRTLS